MIIENAWRTAIARRNPAAPMRVLQEKNLLQGRVLDYGCGRGYSAAFYRIESYDPHFQPDLPEGLFDTITCNFVLNVIPTARLRVKCVVHMTSLLKADGNAYIAVRTDKKNLNGYTRIGTWQGLILMRSPLVANGNGFRIYHVRPGDFSPDDLNLRARL